MCAPAIAIGAMIVGGVMKAWGDYQQGQMQGKLADNAAAVDRQKAVQATEMGSIASAQQVQRMHQIIGKQRSAEAASGTVVDAGTNADLVTDTTNAGLTNANIEANNALREAWGYRADADVQEAQGKYARRSGTWNAIAGLVSTAGAAYGMGAKAYGWGSSTPTPTTVPARSMVR